MFKYYNGFFRELNQDSSANCTVPQNVNIQDEGIHKAEYLAVIWSSTCPLLLIAAVVNAALIQRNYHGWSVSCYLLWLFLVNTFSVILAVKPDAENGCTLLDFGLKFFYFSALCWMTVINFGLWRTFRITQPQRIELRRFIYNCIFCLVFPAVVVTVTFFVGNADVRSATDCALYRNSTLLFYSGPLVLLIVLNLLLFVRTSWTIARHRIAISSTLQKDSKDNYEESFRIFVKLFLMTGSVWIVRVVLIFLRQRCLYLSWIGVTLESIFSITEVAFSITILLHPKFKKWAWDHSAVYQTIANICPCMKTENEESLELTQKS